jgi:hypothetical protein
LQRNLVETHSSGHEVLAKLNRQTSAKSLETGFNALRAEFVNLGYGVPPEVAIQPNRMDI